MSKSEEGELVLERTYIIPLRKVYHITSRRKRAARAIRFLREFIKRHMKCDVVKISNEVNEYIWSRGIEKPPRKIKVKALKYRKLVKGKEEEKEIYEVKVELAQ